MIATPVRIQRSRRKGARLTSPNGLPVVCVSRPSKWGNPFRVGETWRWADGTRTHIKSKADAVEMFIPYARRLARVNPELIQQLRGKNLACWCKPGESCHADVLLELANLAPTQEPK